jgi:hypothetical protein
MTKSSAPTKADLHEMLAQAVRNTQPQPVHNEEPELKRNARHDTKQSAAKRTDKIKGVRASASRKRPPR